MNRLELLLCCQIMHKRRLATMQHCFCEPQQNLIYCPTVTSPVTTQLPTVCTCAHSWMSRLGYVFRTFSTRIEQNCENKNLFVDTELDNLKRWQFVPWFIQSERTQKKLTGILHSRTKRAQVVEIKQVLNILLCATNAYCSNKHLRICITSSSRCSAAIYASAV